MSEEPVRLLTHTFVSFHMCFGGLYLGERSRVAAKCTPFLANMLLQ